MTNRLERMNKDESTDTVDLPKSSSRHMLHDNANMSLKTITPREIELQDKSDLTKLTEGDNEDGTSESYYEKELEESMREMLNFVHYAEGTKDPNQSEKVQDQKEPVQVMAEPAFPSDPIAALI